jgi:hypothetical protein
VDGLERRERERAWKGDEGSGGNGGRKRRGTKWNECATEGSYYLLVGVVDIAMCIVVVVVVKVIINDAAAGEKSNEKEICEICDKNM